MTQDLVSLRARVDSIDEQLVRLLNERASVALEIGRRKAKDGIKAYDPARERVVIERINALNQGPLSKGALEEIYRDIITACREIQS